MNTPAANGSLAERFDVPIDTSLARRFHERIEDPRLDTLDWLWQHVAPEMAGRREARTAALLVAASEGDRNGFRGRMHALFHGPGGTGKTVLKDWCKYTLPDALGCGPDSTGAGLRLNGNTGDLGKLGQAHEGTLCIEEFDKFGREEQKACYEAMSEGYFEVDKGGFSGEIPAETRIIAVANSTDFPQPLMTRFDFIIPMEEYDEQETVEVSSALYKSWRDGYLYDRLEHSQPVLPQFLAWVGEYRPPMDDDTLSAVTRLLERLA